jgi:uncharacterized protein YggE
MKKLFYFFVFAAVYQVNLYPQSNPFIVIETTSTIQIPADEILFNINLSVENDEPSRAFDEHKKLEKNMVNILKDFGVADSNINFSLLQINRSAIEPDIKFQTYQTINVKLLHLKEYEPFQIALLSNGIYNFNGQFASKSIDVHDEERYEAALNKAKMEAETVARSLNKKVGSILEINLMEGDRPVIIREMMFSANDKSGGLIDIPQFLKVNTGIRVKFELTE